jgi:hypothetical protein
VGRYQRLSSAPGSAPRASSAVEMPHPAAQIVSRRIRMIIHGLWDPWRPRRALSIVYRLSGVLDIFRDRSRLWNKTAAGGGGPDVAAAIGTRGCLCYTGADSSKWMRSAKRIRSRRSFPLSNYSGMTVGARGAAGEMLQRPFRHFCRTSCPYRVGTEGLNSYPVEYYRIFFRWKHGANGVARCDK